MSKTLRLSLKSGEKIFINGAVLRVDRKVSLELMNNATFLLANHIIEPDATSTPLRQLYFIIQTMLMDPTSASATLQMCRESIASLSETFNNPEVLVGLATVSRLIDADRSFDSLKALRRLLPLEARIIEGGSNVTTATAKITEQENADSSNHDQQLDRSINGNKATC